VTDQRCSGVREVGVPCVADNRHDAWRSTVSLSRRLATSKWEYVFTHPVWCRLRPPR
jgi:hypothetical protein